MSSTGKRFSQSTLAVYLGLIVNVFLAIIKTTIGILGHSPALLADGVNSTSDVAYYIVVGVFVYKSRKPADAEHPYGHRQLESIAALIVGSFVITTAIAIFWSSVDAIYDLAVGVSQFAGASQAAFWVALFTILVKWAVTRYTREIGEKNHNAAILALARDHRNDMFSAIAAAVGIYLGRHGYLWVDPLAGALVALIILHTGIEILRDSSADLMDDVPSSELKQQITRLLVEHPGVKEVEEVRAHRFGPHLVVNLTIGISGTLSVAEGDAIATEVEKMLYTQIDFLRRVYVHYHPVNGMEGSGVGRTAQETVSEEHVIAAQLSDL